MVARTVCRGRSDLTERGNFIELAGYYFQNEMHDEFELLEDKFKQLWPGLGNLEEIVNPGDEQ